MITTKLDCEEAPDERPRFAPFRATGEIAFAEEAANRLGFLSAEFGFTGPETVPGETGLYPLLRRMRFRRADLAIEISLVLSYTGEEYVAVDLVTGDGAGSVLGRALPRDEAVRCHPSVSAPPHRE